MALDEVSVGGVKAGLLVGSLDNLCLEGRIWKRDAGRLAVAVVDEC